MIKLENVSKTFGRGVDEVHALHNISLDIGRGQIYGVVGASGAGKSTLIRCVNRLEEPDNGAVWVDGEEITALQGEGLRQARRKMGMIFQQFNLLSQRTCAENIAFPLEVAGVSKSNRKRRVQDLLTLVGLEDKARAYPAQLSGGQKQRVAIARALINDPILIMGDEPTGNLDPETSAEVFDMLLQQVRQRKIGALVATHNLALADQMDRVLQLKSGKIVPF